MFLCANLSIHIHLYISFIYINPCFYMYICVSSPLSAGYSGVFKAMKILHISCRQQSFLHTSNASTDFQHFATVGQHLSYQSLQSAPALPSLVMLLAISAASYILKMVSTRLPLLLSEPVCLVMSSDRNQSS